MAQEPDSEKTPGLNPDNPDWYNRVGKDAPNQQDSDEEVAGREGEGDESTPSVAEREANSTAEGGNDTAATDGERGLYTKSKPRLGLFTKAGTSKKKKFLVLGVLSIVLSIFGAIAFLPTILMSTITDKLTDTFYGRAKHAVEHRAEVYVARYVNDVIGGSMRTCGTTVSKDCAAVDPDRNSLFGTLAANWRDNRIETKLLNKYGLEFRLNTNNPNIVEVIKNGDNLGEFGRRSATREVIKSIDAETKFEGLLARRHIRSVMARKYGADKFCFIACSTRDKFDDTKLRGINKIKLRMIARVAEISSARTTAYLLCLTTGCSDADLKRNDAELIKRITAQTDSQIMEQLLKDIDTYKTDNLSQLIVRRTIGNLLVKVGVERGAQLASSALPLVGQIYLAASLAEFVTVLDEKIEDRSISKYMREVNMQQAALYSTQITTMADDVASFQAPVEDNLAVFQFMNGFASSRLSQEISGLENKSTITCNDGVILSGANDPLVCPETHVQSGTAFTPLEEFRNNTAVDAIATIALGPYKGCLGVGIIPDSICPEQATARFYVKNALNIVNGTIGFVGGALIDGLRFLPGIGGLIDSFQNFVSNHAANFFSWASEKIFVTVIDFDAEDNIAFDQAAIGFDVIGNTFNKGDPSVPDASGLGGVPLTALEQTKLDDAIVAKRKENMQYEGVFARYFDVNNSNSLAASTTLAAASIVPSGAGDIMPSLSLKNFASTFTDALGITKKASALSAQDRAELFGVTQYGHAVDSAALSVDPATLSPEACQEYEVARLASAYENNETGETEYIVANPCDLDSVVVDSLTKIYDLDAEGPTTDNASPTDLDCSGYTSVALDSSTRRDYSVAIQQRCEDLQEQCQNVAVGDTLRIMCEAMQFDGVYYGNGYGRWSGSNANGIYGFTASSSNYGIQAASWLENRSEGLSPNNLLECSGLTSVALYQAFGYDGANIGCSGNWTERNNPSLFRQLSAEEIRPGDFLTLSFQCNSGGVGHVAIAASTAGADGSIIVYETNSWGSPVRFTQKNLSDFTGGWSRYIGPGV